MSNLPPKRGRHHSASSGSDQPPPSAQSLPDMQTIQHIMSELHNPNCNLDELGLTLAENGLLDIDAEVAAIVVRQYLLPMFEGGVVERPDLNNFMSSTNNNTGLLDSNASAANADQSSQQVAHSNSVKTENDDDDDEDDDDDFFPSLVEHGAPGNGIYAELKLSDRLLDSLAMTKEEKINLTRRLYSSEAEHARLEEKLTALRKHKDWLVKEMAQTKEAESSVRMSSSEFESECKLMSKQTVALKQELVKQQREHSRLAARLVEEENKVERLTQSVDQNDNTSSLSRLENQVLVDQVRSLHNAVSSLNDMKSLQDEFSFHKTLNDARAAQVFSYKEKIHQEQQRMMLERDELVDTNQDLERHRDLLVSERQKIGVDYEDQRRRDHQELMDLYEKKESIKKDKDRLEKKLSELSEDRDRLKGKLKKYRVRRKMFSAALKTCRHCGREYMESENFNWSCRTHHSEFGGEMWWCCGKLGKEAPGCKYAKHEAKDDDDDMDEQDRKERDEQKAKILDQNVRCFACKEIGHRSKDCPHDPNVRTSYNVTKELERVYNLSNGTQRHERLKLPIGTELTNQINDGLQFEAIQDDDELNMNFQPFKDLVEHSRRLVSNRRKEARGITKDKKKVEEKDAKKADNGEQESESSSDSSGYSYMSEDEYQDFMLRQSGSVTADLMQTSSGGLAGFMNQGLAKMPLFGGIKRIVSKQVIAEDMPGVQNAIGLRK